MLTRLTRMSVSFGHSAGLDYSGMTLGLPIAGVGEVVGALGRGVGVEELADGRDDSFEGSSRRLTQEMLELGEDLPDRLRSGEYLGRKDSFAPAERMVRRTALPLWLPRLSMITKSPGLRVGASTFST